MSRYLTDKLKAELDLIVNEIVNGGNTDVFYDNIQGRIKNATFNGSLSLVKKERTPTHMSTSYEAFSYVVDRLRKDHKINVHS